MNVGINMSNIFGQGGQQQGQPGQQGGAGEAPWWMKHAGRGVGSVGGVIAMGLGVFNCVSLSFWCIVAGIWLTCAGFVVVMVEAPCFCVFIDKVQNMSNWIESKPPLHKAAVYIGISLVPIFMCFRISTVFGGGMIFATGVIYGMMAIGKKAPREEMAARAAADGSIVNPDTMKSTLVDNMRDPADQFSQPVSNPPPYSYNQQGMGGFQSQPAY